MDTATGGKKKGNSRGGSPSSRAAETKPSKPIIGTPSTRRVDVVETIKMEISKALVGLHVGKQVEIDQVLEDLRQKGTHLSYFHWH